eukprot:jgi/Chlat1/4668/Chrsp3S05609
MTNGSTDTPLPKKPLLCICGVFFANAFSNNVLFPFAGFMVADFHVAHQMSEVGYYAGWLASAYNIGTLLSSFFWGWFSDRIGRRPVLLFGLISNAICMLLFGFSKTFAMAVTARFLNGLLSGVVGVGKTALSEISDSSNQAKGFSVIGVCWGSGLLIGPSIGGFLSQPAEKFPSSSLFAEGTLFNTFPYALPCCIGAAVSLIFVCCIFAFLPETKGWLSAPVHDTTDVATEKQAGHELQALSPAVENGKQPSPRCFTVTDDDEDEDAGSTVAIGGSKQQTKPSDVDKSVVAPSECKQEEAKLILPRWMRRLSNLLSRDRGYQQLAADELDSKPSAHNASGSVAVDAEAGVRRRRASLWEETESVIPILLYFVSGLTFSAFDETYPLWSLTDYGDGGLSFRSEHVGMTQTISGFFLIPFQLLVYPRVCKKFGALTTTRAGFFCAALLASSFPIIHTIASAPAARVPVAGIGMVLRSTMSICIFTSIFILITNAVKSMDHMGAVNGIAQTVVAMSRAVGPTLGGSIYAWSISGSQHVFPLDYHMAFLLVGTIHCLGLLLTLKLTHAIDNRSNDNQT